MAGRMTFPILYVLQHLTLLLLLLHTAGSQEKEFALDRFQGL